MKCKPALKQWLVQHKGLSAEATEEQFSKAAAGALMDESLSDAEYMKLQADPEAGEASTFKSLLERMDQRLEKLENGSGDGSAGDGAPKSPQGTISKDAPRIPGDGDGDGGNGSKGAGASYFERHFGGPSDAAEVDAKMPTVRVVGAHERYDKSSKAAYFPETTTKGAKHPMAGQRVFEGGDKGRRYIDIPSDYEMALSGAYIKWAIEVEMGGQRGVPQALRMTDHDRDLIQHAIMDAKWGGVLHGVGSEDSGAIGVMNAKLSPLQQKALLDDSTSGGLEIAPIAFDDQIILTPLLNGEFFPRVNTVNITRGRRIEGASMGNVTLTSGGADGTAIPLFNTASFIAAFDTTIHVVNGSIEIGLDFLSDSPIDVSGTITASYGQQLLTWLDEQVCVGDGSTEPEGIINASGTTSVSSANGAGGPPTVGDYEGLLFGVSKAFKAGFPSNRITFGANETSYQRARGVAVGSGDQRRVFGMNHESYMLLDHPYGINESFTNRQIIFTNWGRYRMYRRMGLTLKVTTEGKELVRDNLMLITARARYGGQLEDGSAAAVMTDAQS